jgi:putative flippase GtrA
MTSLGEAIRRLWSMQVVRFSVVGLAGTGIYYVTALIALDAGLSVEVAHVVAFAVSIVFSYVAQKMVTFRVHGNHRRSIWRFSVSTAIIAGSQFALVLGLRHLSIAAPVLFAISSVYYPVASFCFHSLWTFKKKANSEAHSNVSAETDQTI